MPHPATTFALLCCLLGVLPQPRAETPACHQPFAHPEADAERLRAIARDCDDPVLARLYHHRAAHREALGEIALLARLHRAHGNADRLRLHQGRIHAALLEGFAERAWRGGRAETLDALARGYARAIDRLERTIAGQDLAYGGR
ncbi:hypothetical protein [Marichromatium gracile]|uniref:Uncharacterized protein n=1 Tax=Marichromatium gracile TaxID=1048 RepID=A0ABR5VK19_MARGR|nr:hypothetical protein [Marichromatium gracile]KXX65932.1 hypothetical protein AY586_07595 [Marichromatium gracile]